MLQGFAGFFLFQAISCGIIAYRQIYGIHDGI